MTQTEEAARRARYLRTALKVAVSAIFIGLAIVYYYFPAALDPVSAGFLVLAALPWIVSRISGVEAFGVKVDFLESKVENETNRLDAFLLLSMDDRTLLHLQKLAQPGGYGPFHLHESFLDELVHLHNLGYIRGIGSVRGISDLRRVERHDNLSDYIALTPNGVKFLALRQQVTGPRAVPAST